MRWPFGKFCRRNKADGRGLFVPESKQWDANEEAPFSGNETSLSTDCR
jgi:hypothetical protein